MITNPALTTRDALFQRIDGLVYVLQEEGYPLQLIAEVMYDYLELTEEFPNDYNKF